MSIGIVSPFLILPFVSFRRVLCVCVGSLVTVAATSLLDPHSYVVGKITSSRPLAFFSVSFVDAVYGQSRTMSASGSREDWWKERMFDEALAAAMTAEEEIGILEVAVDSPHSAAAAAAAPISRCRRAVAVPSDPNREEKLARWDGMCNEDAAMALLRSNGSATAVAVDNSGVFLEATEQQEDVSLSRGGGGGRNEQPSDELRQPIPYNRKSPARVFFGRQAVARQAVAHPFVPPLPSPQASGGWELGKGDESRPRGVDLRGIPLPLEVHEPAPRFDLRGIPLPVEVNEPAPPVDAFRAGSNPVLGVRAIAGHAFVESDEDLADRLDPGVEYYQYLSAERLRLYINRAEVFSLLGSAEGFGESMPMQSIPESSWRVSQELPIMHIGGASEGEGFEAEVQFSNHPPGALRSMLRGPESLHKRAKFLIRQPMYDILQT